MQWQFRADHGPPLHHVLTGHPATPLGELGLQAFQLAQTPFLYAGMWLALVTTHMTLVGPYLIASTMDAITQGWSLGRRARSIQLVKLKSMLHCNLAELQREFGLGEQERLGCETPVQRTPKILKAALSGSR